MTRPTTPTNAYQKDGDYFTGDNVWVEDGGRWWTGVVNKSDGSSGQHYQVTVTLPDGQLRQASKSKEELRARV